MPYFTKGNGKELWVVILEKAWAKVHGDYLSIIGGFSDEAFRDLTGAPSRMVDLRNESEEKIWKII